MKPNGGAGAGALILIFLCTLHQALPVSGQSSPSAEEVKAAYLAEGSGLPEALALLTYPELVEQRDVQARLLRALRDPDLAAFQAAAAVTMQVPEIDFRAPRLWRRLETTFLGDDSERKLALLELARDRSEIRQDLRIVGLVAEALLEKEHESARTALALVEGDPALASNPAVVEALASVHGVQTSLELPDFGEFSSEILPLLSAPGADATACIECHKNRTILRLRAPEEIEDEAERALHYYRSLLRVINLDDPESSLLLRKPTRPAPLTQPAPASLSSHTGGARFQVGDSTYQKIVAWIRH